MASNLFTELRLTHWWLNARQNCRIDLFLALPLSKWFQEFKFLDYNHETNAVTCFACRKFSGSSPLCVTDWKNVTSFRKHAKSEFHQQNMLKWMDKILIENKDQSSVASQLSSHHRTEVEHNRLYCRDWLSEAMKNLGKTCPLAATPTAATSLNCSVSGLKTIQS